MEKKKNPYTKVAKSHPTATIILALFRFLHIKKQQWWANSEQGTLTILHHHLNQDLPATFSLHSRQRLQFSVYVASTVVCGSGKTCTLNSTTNITTIEVFENKFQLQNALIQQMQRGSCCRGYTNTCLNITGITHLATNLYQYYYLHFRTLIIYDFKTSWSSPNLNIHHRK